MATSPAKPAATTAKIKLPFIRFIFFTVGFLLIVVPSIMGGLWAANVIKDQWNALWVKKPSAQVARQANGMTTWSSPATVVVTTSRRSTDEWRMVVDSRIHNLNPAVRLAAIDYLAGTGESAALPILVDLTGDADPQVAAKAQAALKAIGESAIESLIGEGMQSGDERRMLAATETLLVIGPAAIQPLIEALASTDWRVRKHVKLTLFAFDEKAKAGLQAAAQDFNNPQISVEANEVLVWLKEGKVIPSWDPGPATFQPPAVQQPVVRQIISRQPVVLRPSSQIPLISEEEALRQRRAAAEKTQEAKALAKELYKQGKSPDEVAFYMGKARKVFDKEVEAKKTLNAVADLVAVPENFDFPSDDVGFYITETHRAWKELMKHQEEIPKIKQAWPIYRGGTYASGYSWGGMNLPWWGYTQWSYRGTRHTMHPINDPVAERARLGAIHLANAVADVFDWQLRRLHAFTKLKGIPYQAVGVH